ncbi:TVP38/TMEM64 family protein [Oleiharenicola lentus]|uniref:TVP38/TMEM64 family protein n=1 Tax=Oleiharenicola lentus TaxID=2508720 RepID=UPI003F66D8B3
MTENHSASSQISAAHLRNFLKGRSADGKPWKPASIAKWLIAGTVLAVAAVFILLKTDWRAIPGYLAGINAFLLIALMAVLPMGGFSIGIIYLVAGVRFGPIWGGVVVTGITAVHLLLSHWIARGLLRGPLERFMKKRRYQLPEIPKGEEIGFSLLGALIPGLPYFARNYLISLSGLPLRIYFWVCLPVYVIRSYLVIFLGDSTTDPDLTRILVLGGFYVLKLSICAYVIWRLRKRYQLKKAHR